MAQQVLADLGIADVPLVAIAKGPDRNAGRERFFLPGKPPLVSIRATRCSISCSGCATRRTASRSARTARGASRRSAPRRSTRSPASAPRKQALLHHFGSARGVARAGLAELERVGGISGTVAKKIYDYFHTEQHQ